MKIDHFYWWSAVKHNARGQIQNQIKNKLERNLVHFSKRKAVIYKNYINNIYVNFNCASNDERLSLFL
jgi:hypothetical protein